MSEAADGIDGATCEKKSRRKILGIIGGTGLLASVGIFGSNSSAEALVDDFCCTLIYNPSNYDTCLAHNTYIWNCTYEASNHILWECACCEAPGRSAVNCEVID